MRDMSDKRDRSDRSGRSDMRDIFVGPSSLKGSVTSPPSKSIAHRALILASLAAGSAAGMEAVQGIGQGIRRETSQDIAATIDCLHGLFDLTVPAASNDLRQLNCKESGSTLRFLIPVAAALQRAAIFSGAKRLAERPLSEYSGIFAHQDITLDFIKPGYSLPLIVRGKLRSGQFYVPGHISSQFITGLMLVLPLLEGDSTIHLTSPLQSGPYIAITQSVLAQFRIQIDQLRDTVGMISGWRLPGNQICRIPDGGITVEADYSQAAFWLTAQFMGQQVEVPGLNPDSVQGDRAMIAFLAKMAVGADGARGGFASEGGGSEGGAKERGAERIIDLGQTPDLAPALAVAACYAPGRTILSNAGRLRLKESDRLAVTAEVLTHIGANVTATADSLIIDGGTPLAGGEIDAHNDHRIVMASAIAALGTQKGVLIRGANAVTKSYPRFFEELKRLGGDVHDIDMG